MSRFRLAVAFALLFTPCALAFASAPPGPSLAHGAETTAGQGQPQSAGKANDAINGAVAGVLVAALTEQFDGRPVSLQLDKMDVQPSSIRDRIVNGEGRVRIGDGSEDWIGFRFSTLYDTLMGSAAYPDITIGGVARDEREIPNDTVLVKQLDDQVAGRLGKEFSSQTVRLQLDRIRTVEAGTRYLRINATGLADFGRDGSTPAQIEALYDRRDRAWLRVNYDLGPEDRDGNVALAGG